MTSADFLLTYLVLLPSLYSIFFASNREQTGSPFVHILSIRDHLEPTYRVLFVLASEFSSCTQDPHSTMPFKLQADHRYFCPSACQLPEQACNFACVYLLMTR